MITLLIADDHPLYRDALRGALSVSLQDIRLLEAGDLPSTIEILEKEDVDLLLLDLHMPGSNDLFGLLHVLKLYSDLPVAVVSGTEDPMIISKIVGCGACELIFSDSPNSCYIKDNRCDSSFTSIKSTNEDSDMILRTSVNCGETTEIYYQAHKPLTWDQQFNVTSLLNINNTTSTVYTQATKPWLNILNGITPTV